MPEHGTNTRYTNYGCKCEPCKEAARERLRAYRASPKGREAEARRNAKARAKREAKRLATVPTEWHEPQPKRIKVRHGMTWRWEERRAA